MFFSYRYDLNVLCVEHGNFFAQISDLHENDFFHGCLVGFNKSVVFQWFRFRGYRTLEFKVMR